MCLATSSPFSPEVRVKTFPSHPSPTNPLPTTPLPATPLPTTPPPTIPPTPHHPPTIHHPSTPHAPSQPSSAGSVPDLAHGVQEGGHRGQVLGVSQPQGRRQEPARSRRLELPEPWPKSPGPTFFAFARVFFFLARCLFSLNLSTTFHFFLSTGSNSSCSPNLPWPTCLLWSFYPPT